MKKIMLVCTAGMSTSLLVNKMQDYAEKEGIEVEIFAESEGEATKYYDEIDCLLLGPQVKYLKSKIKKAIDRPEVVVEVINTVNYGTMNGKKVLDNALDMLGER